MSKPGGGGGPSSFELQIRQQRTAAADNDNVQSGGNVTGSSGSGGMPVPGSSLDDFGSMSQGLGNIGDSLDQASFLSRINQGAAFSTNPVDIVGSAFEFHGPVQNIAQVGSDMQLSPHFGHQAMAAPTVAGESQFQKDAGVIGATNQGPTMIMR